MTTARARSDSTAPLVAPYAPLPGIADECVDASGALRPAWRRFLGALGADDIDRAIGMADRHIRDMGISYRVHGEARERVWPLGRVPLLIEESEWGQIAAAVEQRARLMEAVLADVYGPGRLVAEGVIPAAVVTGSGDYLRPVAGLSPPGGRWMHLYAADIGKGPDGRWWVLGDRAQAPSGAGYSIENRLVLSRAFPALYREMNVERLAPFFRAVRAGLTASAERAEPRICLLSPGPYSETYFEQAYLARYLGLLLVEGDDLIVKDGRVHVRTIAGLKRADVIWRRVDGDFVDPMELNGRSRLGVPGLLDALRQGAVVMGNMPGSGLVESRALFSFTMRMCQRLLREDLKMPNVATWWCGQDAERARVVARLDDMAIAPAFGERAPELTDGGPTLGQSLSPDARARLVAAIGTRGVDYVGQEVVRLSTMPVWQNGALAPRPFVLRVYAAATPEGWRVMPGGFCRVSDQPDARAISMGAGVQAADVWVLASKPVEMATLLPTTESVKIRRVLGNLPSRAADNLFWFGRYLERAEATLRLVRSLCGRTLEADNAMSNRAETLERARKLLVAWGAVPVKPAVTEVLATAQQALTEAANYGSALSLARSAKRAASVIRERLSADAWALLNEAEADLARAGAAPKSEPEAYETADKALRVLAAISGLAQENINRVAGWRFLDMGRRLERGVNTCRFARHFADDKAGADDLDMLLDLIDSQITYRSRYIVGVALAPVRDMAMLDPFNPRSVGFQIDRLNEHFAGLPALRDDGMMEAPRRMIARMATEIATSDAENLQSATILQFEQRLMTLADAIATRYFLRGADAARAERAKGLA